MEFIWKQLVCVSRTVVALLWNINKRITKDWNRTTAGCCANTDVLYRCKNQGWVKSTILRVRPWTGAGCKNATIMISLLFPLYQQVVVNTKKHQEGAALFHSMTPPWLFLQHTDFAILLDALDYIKRHAGCKKSNLIAFSCCWHFCQSCVDSILLSPCLWRLLTVEGETAPEGLFEK